MTKRQATVYLTYDQDGQVCQWAVDVFDPATGERTDSYVAGVGAGLHAADAIESAQRFVANCVRRRAAKGRQTPLFGPQEAAEASQGPVDGGVLPFTR